jgi:sensor histidine kinase YesM
MRTKRRYGFWKVFWVVLAGYILFALIGFIAFTVAPPAKDNPFEWTKLLTWKKLLSQISTFLFIVCFYYFTVNTFYRLMLEKKGTVSYIRTGILAMAALSLFYTVSYFFIDSDEVKKNELTLGLMLFAYFFSTIFYLGISLLVAYLTSLRDEKKQHKILQEQKMQLEVEKSQANFNFLKAQINPHFLHNTLNFLYAKSLPYSAELSEGILTLSDIMRYALNEENTKNGKAPLRDEIEHVRNVIKINQLRFSNNLKVKFDVEGVVNGAAIIPFVLITLVENAFKHGDLKSADDPIIIKLSVNKEGIHFYCRNRKKTGLKELSTGIGLDNIKKRLDLAYDKNYSFNIKDEADFYTTSLSIHQP